MGLAFLIQLRQLSEVVVSCFHFIHPNFSRRYLCSSPSGFPVGTSNFFILRIGMKPPEGLFHASTSYVTLSLSKGNSDIIPKGFNMNNHRCNLWHTNQPKTTPTGLNKLKQILFIKINPMFFQQCPIFFLESNRFMMFLLIFNIGYQSIFFFDGISKSTIAILPSIKAWE